jgi:formylglycine-generating enzyme required for sulfatase activity
VTDARGVFAAVVLLVAATWGALRLAPDPGLVTGRMDSSAQRDRETNATPGTSAAGFSSDLWYLPADSLAGFVEISAGPFTMGSDPGVDGLAFDVERWSARRTQGTVELPTFFVAEYEVTVAQYGVFVQETGHRVMDRTPLEADPMHPVANVAWTDALAYTRWLDAELRQSSDTPEPLARRLRNGWRVDLLTEAQWEKAARGTDGRIYPWGNEPRPDRARYRARTTAPVGSFECPECAYPVHDMSGNVWEWTRSPYQRYPFTDADDGTTIDTEALWVMRGGSFSDAEQNIRAANRGGADPGARRPFIGFRIGLVRQRAGG